jgi:hypothetical protein
MKRPRFYLEIRYARNKDGTQRGPYAFLAMKTESGRKIRWAINRHEWNFVSTCAELKRPTELRDRQREQARLSQKYWVSSRRPGRPSHYPAEAIAILEELGYRVRGKQVFIDWKRYLHPEAVALRFELLPVEVQQFLGGPERLTEITLDAKHRLKRANRNRHPTTFEDCFREALLAACPGAVLAGNPSGTAPDEPRAETAGA